MNVEALQQNGARNVNLPIGRQRNVPQGSKPTKWKMQPLGDLFKTAAGGTPSTLNRAYYDGGKVPWLMSGAVRQGVVRSATTFITELGLANSNAKIFPRETVLVALYGATAGQVGILDIEASTNQAVVGIYPNSSFAPKFIFYLLLSSYDALIAQAIGNAQPNISGQKVKNVPVPCIPLPEQHRIVALLDQAFDAIATAKANTEKNLQNAHALFESHLQFVFTERGKSWPQTTLGEAYDVRDGTHDSPKYQATGHPLITSKNLKHEGLSFEDVKLISQEDYRKINERSAVHKGDVLFAMIGTIGNPTLVEVEPNFSIKNVALFKIPREQSGAFLKHYLDSAWVISKMMNEAKGTTQKFVGLGYLRGFLIKLPPPAMQLEVVKELDKLCAQTQRLASLYQQKLAALDALKKSLLHQAFSGQL